MINETLLNSKKPVKRTKLGTRAEVAARMADDSKPKMIGIPGPQGGYVIRPTKKQIANHDAWCSRWRESMGGAWMENLLEEEFMENESYILFDMFGVDSEEELEYALDCYGND